MGASDEQFLVEQDILLEGLVARGPIWNSAFLNGTQRKHWLRSDVLLERGGANFTRQDAACT